MTTEQKTGWLAELDGFERCPSAACDYRKCDHWHMAGQVYFDDNISTNMLPKYFHSREAIMRLVIKVCFDQSAMVKFLNALRAVVSVGLPVNNVGHAMVSDYDLVTATAIQISDAVIMAFMEIKKL